MSWTRLLGASALLVGSSIALSASANTTVPASMKMKVYRFGVSTSPTCENLTIYTLDAPDFVDFTTNPTLGSASIANGTYQCVALEVDPLMTVTARMAQGVCTTTPQSLDFCEALAAVKANPRPNEIIDGVQPLGTDASKVFDTCAAPGEHFVIYLTTQIPPGAESNAFRPPTSAADKAHGQPLGAPLIVGPQTTGTFVVGVNAVSSDSGVCHPDNPTFSFETAAGP